MRSTAGVLLFAALLAAPVHLLLQPLEASRRLLQGVFFTVDAYDV